eukprot:scaffold36074_cov60-Phaeocystis_antarctica.AAC.4
MSRACSSRSSSGSVACGHTGAVCEQCCSCSSPTALARSAAALKTTSRQKCSHASVTVAAMPPAEPAAVESSSVESTRLRAGAWPVGTSIIGTSKPAARVSLRRRGSRAWTSDAGTPRWR